MIMLNKLLSVAGVAPLAKDVAVEKMATDSRELDANTWWLAANGFTHHALDFYHANQPCAGILYEPPYANPPQGAIAVPDLFHKISALADAFYGNPSRAMTVVGVTGTDGKSSLVHFLAQGLDAAMLGTIGYGKLSQLQPAERTTPDAFSVQRTLAKFRDEGCKTVAMEVSSHALDQGRVAAVDFNIGVFSNLSRDHLDYHKTMENYFLAKAKLFAFPLQHAIINIDDAHGRRLITEHRIHDGAQIWSVSSRGATFAGVNHYVRAENFALHSDGLSLMLNIDGTQAEVKTHLLARFNVDNVLNVAACLAASGHELTEIVRILENLHGVPGRVERIALGEGKQAIVDYAHTGGAIESVLTGIREHVKGKLWVIFGCGGDRDKGKRPLMAASAEKYADEVVITDDNPRTENPETIVEEIAAGLQRPEKAHIVRPREKAIAYVLNQLAPNDAVLIAGKGHETYQIIGTTKHHFSDQEEVRQWLAQ